MFRVARFLVVLLLQTVLLVPAALSASLPRVQIRSGKKGSAIISVSGAYRGKRLRMMVPVGVARQLVAAARKGGVTVSTSPDVLGPMLRVVAGMGDKAVVVARYHRAGRNGQNGASGVRTVQYGLGADARAFYVGRTRKPVESKGARFRGSSTVTRHGWSTFIDPGTLRATRREANDRSLSWYWRPVGQRVGRVTDPSVPLDGFNLGDFGNPRGRKGGSVAVTASPATLINQLGNSL
jgi:hypothetical protein